MSAEYFTMEDVQEQTFRFYEGNTNSKNRHKNNCDENVMNVEEIEEIAISSKRSQARLHEIEEQLEQAEDKCNKLKNQLDFMRKIYQKGDYGYKNNKNSKFNGGDKKSKTTKYGKFKGITNNNNNNRSEFSMTSGTMIVRQNSNAISTDTTGAAVKTINNILSGITDSVNRLSELQSFIHHKDYVNPDLIEEIDFDVKTVTSIKSVKDAAVEVDMPDLSEPYMQPVEKVDVKSSQGRWTANSDKYEINKPSRMSVKSNRKTKKISKPSKKRESSTSVASTNKLTSASEYSASGGGIKSFASSRKTKKSPKSTKRSKKLSKRGGTKSKSTLSSKSLLLNNVSSSKSQNLVELFHNRAAQDSDDSDASSVLSDDNLVKKTTNVVPPLEIHVGPSYVGENSNENAKGNYVEPATPRMRPQTDGAVIRRYELPTVASRMRQVDKNYWRNFNLKSIPFCAATSTGPSHNIGLNIQQVMSIIKTRQPLTGISPTLVHNINLAAGKLSHSMPMTDFFANNKMGSVVGSKIQHRHDKKCPLLEGSHYNYNKLCELAKEVPEEMTEYFLLDNGQGDAGINETHRGDEELQCTETTCWTADSSRLSRCLCCSNTPMMMMSRNCSQRCSGSAYTYNNSIVSSSIAQGQSGSWYQCESSNNYMGVNSGEFSSQCANSTIPSSLKGRERTLKGVLQKLHDDFDKMNRDFEELSQKLAKNEVDDVERAKEELANMESDLNSKEEEIKIVMALYKEVSALKNQVRKLQENSQSTISPCCSHRFGRNAVNYRDHNAILHLTKLLKQIQTYQKYYSLRKST